MNPEGTKRLRAKIESKLGTSVADLRYFARGQNADLYLLDMDDRRRMVVKNIESAAPGPAQVNLEIEGWMLAYLARKTTLPVPHVHWYDSATILMDYIADEGPLNEQVQESAAQALAALHAVPSRFYGLERDTSIASLVQPNHYEADWLIFFRDHRLMMMARAALAEGVIDDSLMAGIERLAERLDQYITAPARPGLVHGDLWDGNIVLGPGCVKAFLDPAIYYADPEIELATIHAFGTFGQPFFERYNAIRPVKSGFWEVRCDLYALYPLLAQLRLGYAAHLERIRQTVHRFAG